MATPYGNGNPFHPHYQRDQFNAYLVGLGQQRHEGYYQLDGTQQQHQGYYNQAYPNQHYQKYPQQNPPMGAQNYQYPNYPYQYYQPGQPPPPHQRHFAAEQDLCGQGIDTKHQQAYRTPVQENNIATGEGIQFVGEGIYTSHTTGTNPWRPSDDKILLNMRAGNQPAAWFDIVATLNDQHTEEEARRRYDQFVGYDGLYDGPFPRQSRPRSAMKQARFNTFGVDDDDETCCDSLDGQYASGTRRRRRGNSHNQMCRSPNQMCRSPNHERIRYHGWTDERYPQSSYNGEHIRCNSLGGEHNQYQHYHGDPRFFQRPCTPAHGPGCAFARPLSRGPSGIAGWTRYPKHFDQTMGKRIIQVSLGLFGINTNPPEQPGVVYRKW